MEIQLPTSVVSYLSVNGAHYDPKGKEGLSNVVIEVLKRGFYLKSKTDKKNTFIELETLGSSLNFSGGYDCIIANLHSPKENFDKSDTLLKEYLANIVVDEESLEKASKLVNAQFMQMKSESRDWASFNFFMNTLKERNKYGTELSLSTITISDVKGVISDLVNQSAKITVSQADNYNIENVEILEKVQRVEIGNSIENKIHYLGGDFKQKVVVTGRNIKRIEDNKEYLVMDEIINTLVSDGLKGYAYEYIRRDHSAAYYAAGRIGKSPRVKTFYMYAGTSEETMKLVLEQTDRIFNILSSGKIEKDRFESAKTSRAGKLVNIYDDLDSYMNYVVSSLVLSIPVMPYEERKKLILATKLSDLKQYAKTIFNDDDTTTFIAGEVADETKVKLSEL